MNKEEREQLRHEVHTLWYNEQDKSKKATLQKVLDLINFTEEARIKLKSIVNLFSSML